MARYRVGLFHLGWRFRPSGENADNPKAGKIWFRRPRQILSDNSFWREGDQNDGGGKVQTKNEDIARKCS